MVTDHPGRQQPSDRLVDFTTLVRQLFWVGVVLGGVVVTGAVLEGLLRGLTFGVLVQWATVWVLALVVTAAVLVAVHALGGAGRARRRGERLSSDDVGALPVLPERPRRDVPDHDGTDHDGTDRHE